MRISEDAACETEKAAAGMDLSTWLNGVVLFRAAVLLCG
jgi:hypothetical protein